MSDTISRQAAIDEIKALYEWHEIVTEDRAIDHFKRLPSAQPEQRWIPCSERLPEYRKLVDVTTRDLRVKLAYLDSIEEDGTDDLWIIPLEDAECALWNVVAWKPRPEPWKGADDEA